jgi:glucan biosynthesis protein
MLLASGSCSGTAITIEPGGVGTPIDLRAYLKSGKEALTETWIYQQWKTP